MAALAFSGLIEPVWAAASVALGKAMSDIDMRVFAKSAGVTITFPPGSSIFKQGDPGDCMYIVQSGVVEMVIGDKLVEVRGEDEAIGLMTMIDSSPRSSTAVVREGRRGLGAGPPHLSLHGL